MVDHFGITVLFPVCVFPCSVPTFKGLPEETLSKLADVLEEVKNFLVRETYGHGHK